MWTLIGTGVGIAYLYSVVATLAPNVFPASFRVDGRVAVYFEAAVVIVSLTLLGQLLETFVFQELRRQASWHEDALTFFHFRDKEGAEVDVVIERGAQALAGVEVKAAATVHEADFRGLRKLRDAGGDRFTAGVVLYDGEVTASFGQGLFAVPVRALWE